jgi:hypothetical protein
VPTLICPVCHRSITVEDKHNQKIPSHHDNKGAALPGDRPQAVVTICSQRAIRLSRSVPAMF